MYGNDVAKLNKIGYPLLLANVLKKSKSHTKARKQ